MAATEIADLDALYPLPPHELSRQWLLTRRPDVGPVGWQDQRLHGWRLIAHPDARVLSLLSRDGTALGWVVEPLAWLGAERDDLCRGPSITLPLPPQATDAEVEGVLYGRGPDGWSDGRGFAGNWTAVLLRPDGGGRLWLGAAHSVVYSPQQQVVATSHNLVPDVARDADLTRIFDPPATGRYYCFGLTAFVGLHRLLPNHLLDLGNFQASRHWPRAGFSPRIPGEDGAARMVTQARRLLSVLAEDYDTFKVPLSAGNDSRAVLACLRHLAAEGRDRIRLFTSSRPGMEAQTDVQIARRLARIARLPHEVEVIVPRPAERAEMLRAFARIGESKWGPILAAPAKATAPAPPGVLALPGMAGEVARASYWHGKPLAPDALTPAAVARRIGAPVEDRVVEAAAAWLDGLPPAVRGNPYDVLDLAHAEQKVGCWDSTSRYLFPGRGRANVSLMATTVGLETMLRLPRDYRAAERLQRDMVAFGWPELLALPFNEPVGTLRLRRFAGRVRSALAWRVAKVMPQPRPRARA